MTPPTTAALVALHEDLAVGIEPSVSLAKRVYDDPLDDLAAGSLRDAGSELRVRADRTSRAWPRVVNL